MNTRFYKDTLGWGVLLWLFGYISGIALFMVVPASMIGWIITPVATLITMWVLVKKIKSVSIRYYFVIAVIWTLIAIVLDFILIVQTFKPQDGYYKIDVYIYYILTFSLPLIVGWYKNQKKETRSFKI
jgi:hypothetical protein